MAFRRAQEKQVSVAGPQKKGKSNSVEYSRRAKRHGPGVLVNCEVDEQQKEKDHNSKHKNAKAFSTVNAPS